MRYGIIHHALWLSPLVLQALWAARVWKLNLVRRYPILFTFLSLATLLGAIGYFLYDSSSRMGGLKLYGWFWLISRPLMWVLFFFLILEIYSRMLESYAGIRRLGQLVLFGGLGSIATIVCTLIYLNPGQGGDPDKLRAVWVVQEQSVYLSIAAFVFVLFLFRRFFGLAVSKNVHLTFISFGFYFAGTAGLLVLRNYMGPQLTPLLDMGGVALYGVCLGAGSLLFSRAGESDSVGRRIAPGAERESAALAARQLATFNDQLVRVLSQ